MSIFNILKKSKDKFPFNESRNVASITCVHVLDENKPILHVSHDMDDGCWQFLCGEEHNDEDARIVALEEIYHLDKTIAEVTNLDYGKKADRLSKDSKWHIS